MNIRALEDRDRGHALFTWREGHKKSPGADRVPWSYYKDAIASVFEKILDDPSTRLLGAYTSDDVLLGWLAMTPGKRVHTVHWCYVKHPVRREGVMTALLNVADVGSRFVYTCRARRNRATLPDGSVTKSLDESLVAALRGRGINAVHVPMKEYLR